MSAGRRHRHDLSTTELDDLLAEALANGRVQDRLAKPYKLVTTYDIPLLGSSSIGGENVYIDRHLRHEKWPWGLLPVDGRKLNVIPGLIRHERLEQIVEDVFGWPYGKIAHPVAQQYEERDYKRRGFDPRDVEKAFKPYIKADAHEKLVRLPTDLDLRPMLDEPSLLAHVRKRQQVAKRTHESVDYVAKSERLPQQCFKCAMFVIPRYGGPACVGVQSPIEPGGWCRRFKKGSLDGK